MGTVENWPKETIQKEEWRAKMMETAPESNRHKEHSGIVYIL